MENTFAAFYFGPIDYYAELLKCKCFSIETFENFQKQTYRNRMNILGANGKLMLNIPIHHNGTRLFKDLQPSYEYNWQRVHLKSLKSAYQSSPYFEYYEDYIIPFYEKKEKYLLDFNLKTIDFINDRLNLGLKIFKTNSYLDLDYDKDFRNQFLAKRKTKYNLPKYSQVFEDKFGFIEGLSILDLLFSEGPNSLLYLKNLTTN